MDTRRASKETGYYRGFQNVSGYSSVALNALSVINVTRGHSCKLKKVRCTRDIVQYFFFEQSY